MKKQKKQPFEKKKKYIFAFVGDGRVKLVESVYLETDGYNYSKFDCGVETMDSTNKVDTLESCFFNFSNSVDSSDKQIVTNFLLSNSFLYIFSSQEKVSEILPEILTKEVKKLQEKADKIMNSYMKVADEVTNLENFCENIKNNNFTI